MILYYLSVESKKYNKLLNIIKKKKQTASKHTKWCSTSLIIRAMKIKTAMRYHLTLVRMANIKKSRNNKCWRECGGKGTLLCCWWECKLVQPLWRTMWRSWKKTKHRAAIWPSNPTPGNYWQKTTVQKDTCTPMFIVALFTIARTWKQLNVHQQRNG